MIEGIHSFLVHPAKHEEQQPEIGGTTILDAGSLRTMLQRIFDKAPSECTIDIVFRPDTDGRPSNPCRDLLLTYAQDPSIQNGRALAVCLQKVTTHRSGLGLLFLMKGTIGNKHTVVVSRFPADQGVVAEENQDQLSVEFIERIFMKSSKAYKSVFYSSDSFQGGFWVGRAIDRQISGPQEISNYWIREFLQSELKTTGPAGTKRLANALRDALRASRDLATKQELVSAATLMRSRDGTSQSTNQLLDKLGMTEQARVTVESVFPRKELMDEVFTFDREEFDRQVLYRSVELDNGAMLLAEDARFEEVFQPEELLESRSIRFTTQGHIVNEDLRKKR